MLWSKQLLRMLRFSRRTHVQQLLADIKYFILQTLAFPPVKATAMAVGGLLGAALVPHTDMILGLGLLFALDWIFGCWNAWRSHRLSSAGMRRGITKAAVYAGFIAATAVVEYLTTGTKWLTAGVVSIALLTELMSIAEHAVSLGVNFAGAEKIREWSRAKLALYGVVYEDAAPEQSTECRNARELLVRQAPMITDPKLRQAAEIYIQEWYHWMCSLKAADMDGDLNTALSRMRHEIHYVVFNAHSHMLKAGLPQSFVQAFLNKWLSDVISRMDVRAQVIIENSTDMAPSKRCVAVRTVVLYHLNRLIFGIRKLEATAGNDTPGALLPVVGPLADESDVQPKARTPVVELEPTEAVSTRPASGTHGSTTARILAKLKTLAETPDIKD